MTPDEAEAHAISAKRQFERLGRDASHIDPMQARVDAAIACSSLDQELSAPATKADIEELKRLILSMKPATPIINNVTYSGRVDAVSRSAYQVGRSLNAVIASK